MTSIKSGVWGGEYAVTQPFGVWGGELAPWYKYAADYGWAAGTHIGIDVATPKYTPIYAAQDGVVEEAGWSNSFRPNPVTVRESDGDMAIYGHLWSASVSPGQKVKAGKTLLGYSGEQTIAGTMIPDGSGPHIHFELRRPDPVTGGYKAVDPVPELAGLPDTYRPGDDYTKDGGLGSQYSFGLPSGAEAQAIGARVGLFVVGGLALAVGVWVVLGAPLPPNIAVAAKLAKAVTK